MADPIPLRDEVTVFYDGACPACAREIAFYRDRRGAVGLAWVDVSREPTQPGLDRAVALARFHARLPDGRLVSGAAAFAEVWRRVPGFRWLGRLVAWGPVTPLAELAYRCFLRVRRLWR
jgi:predicted DCC family thiol-disulfide oxidoreductase YuxK